MQAKLIVAIAVAALTGAAQAQTAGSTAREAARDAGAAAKAAVTPGDQNIGRTRTTAAAASWGTAARRCRRPRGRSGGHPGRPEHGPQSREPQRRSMGTDRTRTDTGTTSGSRPARADRN